MAFHVSRKQREREKRGDASVFRNPRLDVARKREGTRSVEEEVGMEEKKRHGWARTILLKDDRILL